MAATILSSGLYPDPWRESPEVATPVVNTWYTFDVCWGWAASDPEGVIATALSAPGADIDTGYVSPGEHREAVAGRRKAEAGWTPDGKALFLTPQEYAAGFWRIRFPAVGSYTLTLSGVGSVNITAVAAPPAPISPQLTLLTLLPLNRPRSYVYQIAYTGAYPSGGLDLTEDILGFKRLMYAGINDTTVYRFLWSDNKLRVYDSAGEVSGAIEFTTQGLFVGI